MHPRIIRPAFGETSKKWISETFHWAPFEPIDQARRWQGKILDALGWGPLETPCRVLYRKPPVILRAYAEKKDGPVVLCVPAPIKSASIWDLLPEVSAVQQFLRGGVRVYLIQWEAPDAPTQEFGLAEYAGKLIEDALQAIQQETGQARVILAAHSLGGTLAAIFSALHPGKLAGLILLGAPLHFGPGIDAFSPLVARAPRARLFTAFLGKISGSFLNTVSLAASPVTFGYSRWQDALASLADPNALQTHLRVERWTFDELPLPRRLFEEVVDWLYREDRFMRATLKIAGQRATPEQVEAPLLTVVESRSAVVPPESVRPFYNAVSSKTKRWLSYTGDIGVSLQHVGMLVGRKAHKYLWPAIVRWTRNLTL